MPESRVHEQLGTEWQELLAGLPPEPVASSRWLLGPFRYRHSGMARPTVLFAELEDVRAAWNELRASGHLKEYSRRFITPEWTLKDLLAHLASWAREFRQEVETAARGESFDYVIPFAMSVNGPNQWNQVEVEVRKAEPLDAILDEYDAETRRLQALVLELPQELFLTEAEFPLAPTGDPAALWKGASAQIVLAKCEHDRYHFGRIHQWLASLEASPGD